MSNEGALQTSRARSLLLAFAVSHNSSEFCRYLSVVTLHEFRTLRAFMVRQEIDGTLRILGQYGNLQARFELSPASTETIQNAIAAGRVLIEPDSKSSATSSMAIIPFSRDSNVFGALVIEFGVEASRITLAPAELELIQLLAELIAVNSLPRMRATGLLSKIYFDSDSLEGLTDISSRQLRILDEMALGRTNAQIAADLNLSESTIKQEAVRIFRLLGVNSRQRAVSVGKEMGII
jgi:DNA-binding CsgD family transcriptional regulator